MKKWMIGMLALTVLALVLPGAAIAQGPEGCVDTYVVQPGDTLAQIAGELLDNPWAYPALVFAPNQAAANGEGFQAIADPNLIEVGDKLCIPADGTALGTVDVRTFKNLSYLSEFTQKGTAPLVNEAVIESTGWVLFPALYMVGASLLGLVAWAYLRETAGTSLRGTEVPDAQRAAVPVAAAAAG